MNSTLQSILQDSIAVKQKAFEDNAEKILLVVSLMTEALRGGKKIFFFGNGGSAADAQHFAAEFIGRFQKERKALAAIALTTDSSILTALGNDYSFDIIFARQIAGLGQAGDVAFGISTSGNSKNVVEGIVQAKKQGLKTVALTGCGGGRLKEVAEINLIVPSKITARIQESHLCMAHTICQLVEHEFSS